MSAISLLLLACSARPGDEPKLGGFAQCETTIPESPVLAGEPVDEDPLLSRVVIRAEIARARLTQEIHSRVPAILAQEKDRPIGAPGRVTYVVKRGTVTPSLQDGKLRVATTALADINVCKPLGPFCVGYGECHPSFVSTVDLPLALTEEYGWQQPSADVQVARGCNIAGFDVTPRLRSLAEANLGSLKNQVAAGLPELKPGLEQSWNLISMPVFLNKDWCLRVTPRALTQGPAKESPGHFGFSAALDAEVAVRRDCKATDEKSELPPLRSEASLPESGNLALSQLLTTEEFERQLAQKLVAEVGEGEKVSEVKVRPARIDEQDVLLLALTLEGRTCGTAWFRALPVAVAADQVKLGEVSSLTEGPEGAMKALREHIERAAVARPGFTFAATRNELENLVGSLSQGLTGMVALQVSLGSPTPLPPDVTGQGLELWSAVELVTVARVE